MPETRKGFDMNIGVSPITNTIYAGRSKDNGDGIKEWVGEKQDITDEAIRAVFDWFINNLRQTSQMKPLRLSLQTALIDL